MAFSPLPSTPVRPGLQVLPGHIVVNNKWIGSEIVGSLTGKVRIIYEENLGVVDFHPASDVGTIYLSESELVTGTTYRRKLVKLRKSSGLRGTVLAEKTSLSSQYFPALQKFAVLEIGLILFPVANQRAAGQLLWQMVVAEGKKSSNPFLSKALTSPLDSSVLNTVQLIPGLGDIKAKALLERFKSIRNICNADVAELTACIGKTSAYNVKSFFQEAGPS